MIRRIRPVLLMVTAAVVLRRRRRRRRTPTKHRQRRVGYLPPEPSPRHSNRLPSSVRANNPPSSSTHSSNRPPHLRPITPSEHVAVLVIVVVTVVVIVVWIRIDVFVNWAPAGKGSAALAITHCCRAAKGLAGHQRQQEVLNYFCSVRCSPFLSVDEKKTFGISPFDFWYSSITLSFPFKKLSTSILYCWEKDFSTWKMFSAWY